jgi:hypothetical protein
MADAARPGLLERIEEQAREVPPLWQWLLWLGLTSLPTLLFAACVALIERASGPMHPASYLIALIAVLGVTVIAFIVFAVDTQNGYSRRLLRQPKPEESKPGVFRLAWGMFAVFYQKWWVIPVMIVGIVAASTLAGGDEAARPVSVIFWNGMANLGWYFAYILGAMGLLVFVGLIIRQRLQKRDRPV